MSTAPKSETRNSLANLDPDAWNRLVPPDNVFCEHDFLTLLEETGCVAGKSGWNPRYELVWNDDILVAAAPAYIKDHSYGEFVFDWSWAEAFANAGLSYYPKGVVASPLTPVTGRKILYDPAFPAARGVLLDRMIDAAVAKDLSSWHVLFPEEDELPVLEEHGFLIRIGYQFHWTNRGYKTFDDFLADLRSSKRKQIRKERRSIQNSGIEVCTLTGDKIKEEHLAVLWEFYLQTHSQRMNPPYLTRRFFDKLLSRMRDRLFIVMARDGEKWIAGTLNFMKGNRIYGRYWGALRSVPNLHFECCYYRLIDYAIEHNLEYVEAGAQGEQKFLRGYGTTPTWSAHWIKNPAARASISRYLAGERTAALETIDNYNSISPLKHLRSTEE